MPRSYWLPIFAAVGLALAGATDAHSVGHNASGHSGTYQAQAKPKADAQPSVSIAVQNDIKSIARTLEAANNKQPSAAEQQQAKDNLDAQQRMARWAARMFWAALAEMLVTAAGVFLVWRTLKASWAAAKAAERAVKVTRNVGRAQARAYLSAEGADMYTQALCGRITLHIKNTGDTPAQWVEVESNARLVEVGSKAADIGLNPHGTVQQWPLDPADGKEFTCTPDCGGITLNELIERAVGEKKSVVFQGAIRWKTVFEETYESTFFFWRIADIPNIETNERTHTYREIPQIMRCPCLPTPTYRRIDRHRSQEKKNKHKSVKFWDHLFTALRR